MRLRRTIAAGFLAAALLALATVYVADASPGRAAAARIHAELTAGRYRRHMFTNVTVTRDVLYRQAVDYEGRTVTLRLDVYAPAGDDVRQRAAVVWLHSGGFIAGTKAEEAKIATDFAQRGYVAIAIDYRQRAGMQWFDMAQRTVAARDAYEDAETSIAWLRAHASEYGIDPALIFAGGYSAGGITAFDLAFPPNGSSSSVAGAVPISGYSNHVARPGEPPVLAFHGADDPMVPHALADASCATAREVGDRCDIVTFNGAAHEIGTTRFSEITDQAADFVASVIAGR